MKFSSRFVFGLAVMGVWLAQCGTASAQFLNSGFETGGFDDWFLSGTGYVVGTVGTPGIAPVQGNFHAGISTAANSTFGPNGSFSDLDALDTMFGLSIGTILGVKPANASDTVFNGSAIMQSVTVTAGTTVSLSWNFVTREDSAEGTFNDYAFVVMGSNVFRLQAANDLVNGGLNGPAVDLNNNTYRTSGYQTFSFQFTTAGTFNVGVGVVNVGDDGFSSGLLVDNFTSSAVPEPSSIALVGLSGLAVGAHYFRRWRKDKRELCC